MDALLLDSISTLGRSFMERESTPTHILEETLKQIGRMEPSVNAIGEMAVESARRAADAADKRWARNEPLSALDGVPVTVKDSINVAGLHWRHGAAANSDLATAPYDSPPAARLRESGAVVVGKTTMPDLGMMAAGVSSLYGITRNPWNLSSSPGGSSSGAAAALACGIGYGAVGTDIAGSVRIPAGFCGLAAIKPTQGRIAHTPASNMRSAAPMARTVGDLRVMFDVLSRADSRDMLCLLTQRIEGGHNFSDFTGLKVGVLEHMGYRTGPEQAVLDVVRAAADALRNAGATVHPVGPAFAADPYGPLDRLFQVKAWAELLSIAPHRRHQVEPHLASWAEGARDISAVTYHNDLAAVAATAGELSETLSDFDIVLSPTFARVGFPAEDIALDPQAPLADCHFTCWFNQTGQPSGSVCFGLCEQMPVGVQVVASRFEDGLVLRVCEWLEKHRPFEMEWPVEGPGFVCEGAKA